MLANPDKHQSESASLSERYGPKQQLSFAKGSKSPPEAKQRARNGHVNPNYHTSNLEIEIFDNAAAEDSKDHDSDDNYIQTFNHEALVCNSLFTFTIHYCSNFSRYLLKMMSSTRLRGHPDIDQGTFHPT